VLDLWNGKFDRYSEEWLFQYAHLRAIEWSALPGFVAQPIAPLALIFLPAWIIIITLVVSGWARRLVRYRLIGISFVAPEDILGRLRPHYDKPAMAALNLIRVADTAQWFVRLKWPISVATAFWLFREDRLGQALLAGLWPVVTLVLLPLAGASGLVGAIQKRFLLSMGFAPLSGDVESSWTDEFHRSNCDHFGVQSGPLST
jgi:hypothetical protein